MQELRRFLDLGVEDEENIRAARDHILRHRERIVAAFYDKLQKHEGTSLVLRGDRDLIARLMRTLDRWLEEVLQGRYDEEYFERRAAIGRVHVKVGLAQHYMVTAMNVFRREVEAVLVLELHDDVAHLRALRASLNKAFDLDLAVMLGTYLEDKEARLRVAERFATVGRLGAVVGHELRNPLAVVSSSLYSLRRLLGDRADADDVVERHLDKIERNVAQANRIIADLLGLARGPESSPAPTDLHALLREVARDLPPAPAEVRLEIGPGELRAIIDPLRVARAVRNLIENGALAEPRTGPVVVTTSQERLTVEIRVRDHGPGVPAELRDRIFEPLFTTRTIGTGLGLPIARTIAEEQGGRLELRTTDDGCGALFVIALPRAPDPTPVPWQAVAPRGGAGA